jgi:hypothetical protein
MFSHLNVFNFAWAHFKLSPHFEAVVGKDTSHSWLPGCASPTSSNLKCAPLHRNILIVFIRTTKVMWIIYKPG